LTLLPGKFIAVSDTHSLRLFELTRETEGEGGEAGGADDEVEWRLRKQAGG
jgi:hypothetical protein